MQSQIFYICVGTSKAEQALQSIDATNAARLKKLFATAIALAKNRQPYTSFMWMCDMQGMSGLDLDLSYRSAFTYMIIINQAAAKPHSYKINNFVEQTYIMAFSCNYFLAPTFSEGPLDFGK